MAALREGRGRVVNTFPRNDTIRRQNAGVWLEAECIVWLKWSVCDCKTGKLAFMCFLLGNRLGKEVVWM